MQVFTFDFVSLRQGSDGAASNIRSAEKIMSPKLPRRLMKTMSNSSS